jgi:hypothetical protein
VNISELTILALKKEEEKKFQWGGALRPPSLDTLLTPLYLAADTSINTFMEGKSMCSLIIALLKPFYNSLCTRPQQDYKG